MNSIIKKIPTDILNSKNFECKIYQHKIIFLNSNKEFFNMVLPPYTQVSFDNEGGELKIHLLDKKKIKEFNLLKNALNGFQQGFIKKLILKGIGFKVSSSDDKKV